MTIGADDLSKVYTRIDAAYTVHDDMRSHTAGVMLVGRGVLHCKRSKQKLHVKSFTKAELVGSNDYIPYNP